MNASSLKREIEMLLGLTGPQAANFWRIAAAPSPPTPVPIPYPNFSSLPDPAQAAGDRFNGKYLVTGATHRYSRALHDLVACVRAAAANDLAAARIAPVWQRVKGELGHEPAHVRSQLGHELAHTLQQRGG